MSRVIKTFTKKKIQKNCTPLNLLSRLFGRLDNFSSFFYDEVQVTSNNL